MTEDLPVELHALLCDCIRLDANETHSDSLRQRIAVIGWERLFDYADEVRLGSVLVRAVARLGLAPAIPAITLPDGRMTITRGLAQREVDHMARRGVLTERLAEIAAALNAAGISPVVLKGGRSLVAGGPDWRYLRDLDLLVEPSRAAEAQDIVLSMGYRPDGAPRPRLVHHHLHELYRHDLPGWVEIHRRGGPSRVEQFLSTREMLDRAVVADAGLRVLPAHLSVLHGMIHHHVGHRAVKHAAIAPKGLFEFAAEMSSLGADERDALMVRAASHPRVLAILDLWVAAAADLFGMPVAAPLTRADDAADWWAAIRSAEVGKGIGPELRAATQAHRLRRSRGGQSRALRLYWRLTMPLSFIKRPMLLPRPARRPKPAP